MKPISTITAGSENIPEVDPMARGNLSGNPWPVNSFSWLAAPKFLKESSAGALPLHAFNMPAVAGNIAWACFRVPLAALSLLLLTRSETLGAT